MKKLNITYDTFEIEKGKHVEGETCYTVDRGRQGSRPAAGSWHVRCCGGHHRKDADGTGNPAGPSLPAGQHQAL